MEKILEVVILGAGIMGITTAVRLIELFPNIKITIIAEKISTLEKFNTTSDVSAGFWKPFFIEGNSDALINKWGKETYERQIKEALSENALKLGVQTISAYIFNDKEKVIKPFWAESVAQFHEMNINEIANVCLYYPKFNIKSGFSFLSVTVICNKYIPSYIEFLKSKGVQFIEKKLTKLTEFVNDSNNNNKYDYIINCVGLGAQHFCDDKNMRAMRGQVVKVRAPWLKHCVIIEHETIYMLPLSDLVVCGGSAVIDNYNLINDEEESKRIIENCSKIIPAIKDAKIVEKQVGLRPFRNGGVRLELEIIFRKFNLNHKAAQVKVIHNYGHGGSGVTLCWGCASDICDLIKADMNLKKSSNL